MKSFFYKYVLFLTKNEEKGVFSAHFDFFQVPPSGLNKTRSPTSKKNLDEKYCLFMHKGT